MKVKYNHSSTGFDSVIAFLAFEPRKRYELEVHADRAKIPIVENLPADRIKLTSGGRVRFGLKSVDPVKREVIYSTSPGSLDWIEIDSMEVFGI